MRLESTSSPFIDLDFVSARVMTSSDADLPRLEELQEEDRALAHVELSSFPTWNPARKIEQCLREILWMLWRDAPELAASKLDIGLLLTMGVKRHRHLIKVVSGSACACDVGPVIWRRETNHSVTSSALC